MHPAPRSRRQTRASLLSRLLAPGARQGLFRPRLAAEAQLTEASISRIVAELKAEGLVQENRCPAPYPGGPTALVTLSETLHFGALEVANDRVTTGAGPLHAPVFLDRRPVPRGAGALTDTLEAALHAMAEGAARHGLRLRQIGVSLPGYRGDGAANPILPIDMAALRRHCAALFPGVPVAVANAVVAQAAARLHDPAGPLAAGGRQLFAYLAHGVAGAWIDHAASPPGIRALELGHVVLDPQGPLCRCGHRGCLEASTSTTALAGILGVPEAGLLAAGEGWATSFPCDAAQEAALREVLHGLGLVLGNALNLLPATRVVVCGWPAALPELARDAIAAGLDRSLFGGWAEAGLALDLLPAAPGSEPGAALAWAAHRFVEAGGIAVPQKPDRDPNFPGEDT